MSLSDQTWGYKSPGIETVQAHCDTSSRPQSCLFLLIFVQQFCSRGTLEEATPELRQSVCEALVALREALGNGPVIKKMTHDWLHDGMAAVRELVARTKNNDPTRRWTCDELLGDAPTAPLSSRTIEKYLDTSYLTPEGFHRLRLVYWTTLRDLASLDVMSTSEGVELVEHLLRKAILASCAVASPPETPWYDKGVYKDRCTRYKFSPSNGLFFGIEDIRWAPGTDIY